MGTLKKSIIPIKFLREKLGRCAIEIAYQNHDGIGVRSKFRKLLAKRLVEKIKR